MIINKKLTVYLFYIIYTTKKGKLYIPNKISHDEFSILLIVHSTRPPYVDLYPEPYRKKSLVEKYTWLLPQPFSYLCLSHTIKLIGFSLFFLGESEPTCFEK